MTIEQVGKDFFWIPEFIHDFGDSTRHTHKGSLRRHLAVEKILYKLSTFNMNNDALPSHKLLALILNLSFGLNCNFPTKDVAKYIVWSFRRGYYEYLGRES